MRKNSFIILTLLSFMLSTVIGPLPQVMADDFRLPVPGVMIHLSPPLDPPILKGIKVDPDNPFKFDFILDQGESYMSSPKASVGDLKQEATKLIKYFLASLTIPENDLWVNLSPYEKDRIIPHSFGLTEMGRDLLAEDYMLKQITASLIYPDDEIGRKFWKRIYEEAQKRFGTTNIPVNTFNKVWIVPDKAIVYENAQKGTAYVVESKLKVMLEQDYLSLEKHQMPTRGHVPLTEEKGYVSPSRLPSDLAMNVKAPQGNNLSTNESINALGSQIVREIVIPELTREVNEGKNFAQLRQVYNSLILATWYKKKIKESILEQVYADKNKIKGVEYNKSIIGGQPGDMTLVVSPSRLPSKKALNMKALQRNEPTDVELIYQRYLRAFKKGVYNFIKEDLDPGTQETVPRKYFSGGVKFKWSVGDRNISFLDRSTAGAAMISKIEHQNTQSFVDIGSVFNSASTPFNQVIPGKVLQKKNRNSAMLSVEHVAASYEGGNIDFILDADTQSILIQAGIDPQQFMQQIPNKLKELSDKKLADQDPARMIYLHLKLRMENFIRKDGRINDVISIYTHSPVSSNFTQGMPRSVVEKFMFFEILKKIERCETSLEKIMGEKNETYLSEEEFYNNFSADEILEIIKSYLRVQDPIPSQLWDLVFRPGVRTIHFSKSQIMDFKAFNDEYFSGMDIDSRNSALHLIIYDTPADQREPLVHQLNELKRRKNEMSELNRQWRDMHWRVVTKDIPSWEGREELLALDRKILAIDANSRFYREDLDEREAQIRQEKEEIQRFAEAHSRASVMIQRHTADVLSAITHAVKNQDNYDGLALFEILLSRDLSAQELNTLLVLLPKIKLLDSSKALKIYWQLVAKYRRVVIQDVFNHRGVSSEQGIKLVDLYQSRFQDLNGIDDQARQLVPELSLATIEGIRQDLSAMDENMHRENINFNSEFYGHPSEPAVSLEDSISDMNSPGENLNIAKVYFQSHYGITLDIPFEEDTSLVAKIGSGVNGELPELYTKNEIPRMLERLMVVDQALARLPRWLVLNSISLQKFYIVKNMRAFYRHSEEMQQNKVAITLENDNLIQTLYHELGHSFHGKPGSFSVYFDPYRLREILNRHVDFFSKAKINLHDLESNPGSVMWNVFQYLYNQRLAQWKEFSREMGVIDLNAPFKHRDPTVIEKRYGIKVSRSSDSQNQPSIVMEYVFERPLSDSFDGKLERNEPEELIAEYAQLYVLHPESLQHLDPIGFDLMKAIIGDVSNKAMMVHEESRRLIDEWNISNPEQRAKMLEKSDASIRRGYFPYENHDFLMYVLLDSYFPFRREVVDINTLGVVDTDELNKKHILLGVFTKEFGFEYGIKVIDWLVKKGVLEADAFYTKFRLKQNIILDERALREFMPHRFNDLIRIILNHQHDSRGMPEEMPINYLLQHLSQPQISIENYNLPRLTDPHNFDLEISRANKRMAILMMLAKQIYSQEVEEAYRFNPEMKERLMLESEYKGPWSNHLQTWFNRIMTALNNGGANKYRIILGTDEKMTYWEAFFRMYIIHKWFESKGINDPYEFFNKVPDIVIKNMNLPTVNHAKAEIDEMFSRAMTSPSNQINPAMRSFINFLQGYFVAEDIGIDGDKLNRILAENSQYYDGIKLNKEGSDSFRDIFAIYMKERHEDLVDWAPANLPSLSGLWVDLKDAKPEEAFDHISKWMILRIKQLSEIPDKKDDLARLIIDATRFVQLVLRGSFEARPTKFQKGFHSMISLLNNEAWNCQGISDLTAVLMGLWGARGVSVVDVVETPRGKRYLPSDGHVVNLVRVGDRAVYLDQGGVPVEDSGIVRVIINGKETEIPIALLPHYPGAEGLTIDRVFAFLQAQNELNRIRNSLGNVPGIRVTKDKINISLDKKLAAGLIGPLEIAIGDFEKLSLRVVDKRTDPVRVTSLGFGYGDNLRSHLQIMKEGYQRALLNDIEERSIGLGLLAEDGTVNDQMVGRSVAAFIKYAPGLLRELDRFPLITDASFQTDRQMFIRFLSVGLMTSRYLLRLQQSGVISIQDGNIEPILSEAAPEEFLGKLNDSKVLTKLDVIVHDPDAENYLRDAAVHLNSMLNQYIGRANEISVRNEVVNEQGRILVEAFKAHQGNEQAMLKLREEVVEYVSQQREIIVSMGILHKFQQIYDLAGGKGNLAQIAKENNKSDRNAAMSFNDRSIIIQNFILRIFGINEGVTPASKLNFRIDEQRLNEIMAQNARIYPGVSWGNEGQKLFEQLFARYRAREHDNVFSGRYQQFPSLLEMFIDLEHVNKNQTFDYVTKWMMSWIKKLQQPGHEAELMNFMVDTTRLVQVVLRGELNDADVVKFDSYNRDRPSMASLLKNEGWNCVAISELTVVLMGLWGAKGVSVVEVKESPDGIKYPLADRTGHVANLVRVGKMAAYVDQGVKGKDNKGIVKVFRGNRTEEISIAALPSYPGAEGITFDRLVDLLKRNLRSFAQAAVKPVVSRTGGIDLTAGKMNVETRVMDSRVRGNDNLVGVNDNFGRGIKFHLSPGMLAELQNAPGFVPVIISVKPMTDLKAFLGI